MSVITWVYMEWVNVLLGLSFCQLWCKSEAVKQTKNKQNFLFSELHPIMCNEGKKELQDRYCKVW